MLDPYTGRLFQLESAGNPNATTGSNRGLGQFGPREEAQFGITDQNRANPDAQAAAVSQEAQLHGRVLRNALGRDPTPGELYLTHQQGIAGGPALLAGGDRPAWQVLRPYYRSDAIAKQAITGNLPADSGLRGVDPDKISADQFSRYWVGKFERGLPGAAPAQNNAPATSAASPVPPFNAIPPAQAPANMGLFGSAPQQQPAQQQPEAAPQAPSSFFGMLPAFHRPPDMSALMAFLQSQGRA